MRIWTKIVDEILQPFVVDITFTVSHRHNVHAKGEARARRFIEDAPDVVSRERRHGWIYGGYGSEVVRQAVDKYRKTLAQMDEELTHGPASSRGSRNTRPNNPEKTCCVTDARATRPF